MNRNDVHIVLAVLNRIKDRDVHVERAIAICNKKLAEFNSHKGQLKESYETYQLEYK